MKSNEELFYNTAFTRNVFVVGQQPRSESRKVKQSVKVCLARMQKRVHTHLASWFAAHFRAWAKRIQSRGLDYSSILGTNIWSACALTPSCWFHPPAADPGRVCAMRDKRDASRSWGCSILWTNHRARSRVRRDATLRKRWTAQHKTRNTDENII